MDTLLKSLDWFQPLQAFLWEYFNYIFSGLLVMVIILPFLVGLVVIMSAVHLSAKIPKVLHRLYCPNIPYRPEINVPALEKPSRIAFVLQFQKRQQNEYYFQSASTSSYNLDSLLPQWILSTILSDFLKPYTKTSIERVLVIIPSLQSSISSLKNTSGILLKQGYSHPVGSPCPHTNLTTGNSVTVQNSNDSIKLDTTPSLNKLSYLDLSLKQYWSSPKNFYKEKRPIHFKFLSDT